MAALEDTLVAGDSTDVWGVAGTGEFTLIIGGSFETTTLTLQCATKESGTFTTLYLDDGAGTPTAQTFTVTQVPSSAATYVRLYVLPGLWFKATTNSTGTTPAITVAVSGPNVLTPSST